MNDDNVRNRMGELIEPVDKCIMLTDDRNELIMLACVMLQRTRELLDSQIGVKGRKELFKGYV